MGMYMQPRGHKNPIKHQKKITEKDRGLTRRPVGNESHMREDLTCSLS
jgi:hypothetical protein